MTETTPSFYRLQLDDGKSRDLPAYLVLHVFEPESASAVQMRRAGNAADD